MKIYMNGGMPEFYNESGIRFDAPITSFSLSLNEFQSTQFIIEGYCEIVNERPDPFKGDAMQGLAKPEVYRLRPNPDNPSGDYVSVDDYNRLLAAFIGTKL